MAGAPKGNKNATKNRPWYDALRKALLQYEDDDIKRGEALTRIAERLVKAAAKGNQGAMEFAVSEIGNRLDGRPHQSVEADVTGDLKVSIVRFTSADKPTK